jgi:putative heme-binding domain-containing protein
VTLAGPLLSLARNDEKPEDLRIQALASAPAGLELDRVLFGLVLRTLNASNPPLIRVHAAAVASRAKLTESQLLELADHLPALGPLEISRVLSAFDGATKENVGLSLVAGLKQSKAISAIPADALRNRFNKFPAAVQQEAKPLLAQISVNSASRKQHLDEIQASLTAGDHRRGQNIFNGTKAACSTCHPVGYLGGQIGPDLTRIGAIRTERDLLEAVVYPSISFARGFEPMIITTKDGEEHSGLLKRETSDVVTLVSGPANEQRLARADISEMRPGAVSIMPEGLDQQLTRQELADLVAFLRALK